MSPGKVSYYYCIAQQLKPPKHLLQHNLLLTHRKYRTSRVHKFCYPFVNVRGIASLSRDEWVQNNSSPERATPGKNDRSIPFVFCLWRQVLLYTGSGTNARPLEGTKISRTTTWFLGCHRESRKSLMMTSLSVSLQYQCKYKAYNKIILAKKYPLSFFSY